MRPAWRERKLACGVCLRNAWVHDRKNNAAYDNENVEMFRAELTELGKAEQNQSGPDQHPPRKIVGVYAGWRGLSAKWEPFKELSFWERKNTAHKIGYGAMTEPLADLSNRWATWSFS